MKFNMTTVLWIGVLLIVAVLATFVPAQAPPPLGPGTFEVSWYKIVDGGGITTGGSYEVIATIGQTEAGGATGGGFDVAGGFWPVTGNPAPLPCPGDIAPTGGNNVVNVDDLLAIVNGWGICAIPCPPQCIPDIAPTGGNCTVNVDDLLAVINAWGPCP